MCDAISAGVGMGALSLGGSLLGSMGQASAASAYNSQASERAQMQSMMTMSMAQSQYALTMEQLQQSQQFAAQAATNQMEALELQAEQIQGAAALDTLERVRQGMRDKAKAVVGAAEAGVGGNTAKRVEENVLFQQGYDTSIIDVNRQNLLEQTRENIKGTAMDYRGKLMEIGNARVKTTVARDNAFLEGFLLPFGVEQKQGPDPLMAGLGALTGAISSGLGAYSSVKSMSVGPKAPFGGKFNMTGWNK